MEPRGEIKQLPIEQLRIWDKNPRSITVDAYERLKKQILKFGQYKPLLCTPEGEVLGGNMRLRALKELGVKTVWVNVITPKDENEKFEISLSDNDRAGYYDEDMLANMLPLYKLDLKDYSVDLYQPKPLTDILNPQNVAPVKFNEEQRLDEKKKITCPNCSFEFIP